MFCFREGEGFSGYIVSLLKYEANVEADDVSPVSSSRIRSFVTLSSPSRNDSSDREMWPS